MEQDGARQFHELKANLERAVREAEAGEFEQFDPQAYEPDAGTKLPCQDDNRAANEPHSGKAPGQ